MYKKQGNFSHVSESQYCVCWWSVTTTGTCYGDIIKSTMASHITAVLILYPTVCSGVDQRKHQSSTSQAFVRGIHRWPVNSPHKGPVRRKMFPLNCVTCRASPDMMLMISKYKYGDPGQSLHVVTWSITPMVPSDQCKSIQNPWLLC